MSKSELQEELARVDEQITELSAKRNELTQKIKNITIDEDLEEFNAWNLSEGTCMIWFAKDEDGHYLIESVKVLMIDSVRRYFRGLFGRYYVDYNSGVFEVSADWMPFSSLKATREVFNVYIVDEPQLAVLHTHLCELEVTPAQLRTCENAFANGANKKLF